MKAGICPKCRGSEIIVAQPAEYGDDSVVPGDDSFE